MSEIAAGPAGRIERVRALMVERGYDAIVVRDEANLRWAHGREGRLRLHLRVPARGVYYG